MIEVGQCICQTYDDGTTEVIQADEYAEFGEETMANPLFSHCLARDGAFVMVKGQNSYASYELVDQSYMKDVWIGKRIRYQLYRGEEV